MPLEGSSLIWDLRVWHAAVRFDPEQNDNTWFWARTARTHLNLSPNQKPPISNTSSSGRAGLRGPASPHPSRVNGIFNYERKNAPSLFGWVINYYSAILFAPAILIPTIAHSGMLWINTSGHQRRNINMRDKRVPLKTQRPSAGPPVLRSAHPSRGCAPTA